MKNFGKNIMLTGKILKRYAGAYIPAMAAQILAYSFLICYNAVMVPVILSMVYQALEAQNQRSLYLVCGCGALVIALAFFLCYLNNVYLDMYSFRIGLEANRNICRELFSLSFDGLNSRYEEGDIQNRIDECTGCVTGIFPLLVSVLANVLSMAVLLVLGGRISAVLAGITLAVMLVSSLAARQESRKRSGQEKRRQEAEAKAGAVLYQTIGEQEILNMYGVAGEQWREYQRLREAAWESRWMQEQAGMVSGSVTETFTGLMRGVLSAFLFRFYQNGSLDSGTVASSFSIFDQLKSVAGSFSDPISRAGTFMVSVRRLDEMLQDGKVEPEERLDAGKSPNDTPPVLSLEHVSYMAGERCILRDVSMTIREGEKVAIIGENGCGKSTLLKLAGGLNHPKAGEIDLLGVRPGEASSDELRRRISYIPSESHLYTGDVKSNIGMNLDGEDGTAIAEACIAAELSGGEGGDVMESSTSELSGGQAQRVNIARGLVNHAPLLLADEPDAGLPPAQGRRLMEKLLRASDTAVVVTHRHEYLDLFDRVVAVENGRIDKGSGCIK